MQQGIIEKNKKGYKKMSKEEIMREIRIAGWEALLLACVIVPLAILASIKVNA